LRTKQLGGLPTGVTDHPGKPTSGDRGPDNGQPLTAENGAQLTDSFGMSRSRSWERGRPPHNIGVDDLIGGERDSE
jgi:hypothetical protein